MYHPSIVRLDNGFLHQTDKGYLRNPASLLTPNSGSNYKDGGSEGWPGYQMSTQPDHGPARAHHARANSRSWMRCRLERTESKLFRHGRAPGQLSSYC